MGAGPAVGVVIVIVIIVGAFFLFGGTLLKSSSAGVVDPAGAVETEDHVRYEVPNGQDPAVVMAALSGAGYTCALDTSTVLEVVTIRLPTTQAGELERIRQVLAGARATNLGGPPVVDTTPVRFLDEGPGAPGRHSA